MKRIRIYSDGGARGNPGPGAAAFVVVKGGKIVFKGSKFLGKTTNNKAEYMGVIMALSWLLNNEEFIDKKGVDVFLDSQLVTRQLNGFYKIKSKNLKPLILTVKNLMSRTLVRVNYFSLPRERNRLADALFNKEIDENI